MLATLYGLGLENLDPYLDKEDWTENEIKERADDLCDKALEKWGNSTDP